MGDEKNPTITKQLQLCDDLKENITSKIEEITANYNKTNQELFAEVLNKFSGSDDYTAEYVGKDFSSEDIIDNMNVFSSGDEEMQKKIKANSATYEKEKTKIKNQIIGLFKLKARAYNLNDDILSKLETELTDRKKQATKLNEEIANGEKEVKALESDYEQKEKQLQEATQQKAELDKKIEECKELLNKASEKEEKHISKELGNLSAEASILNKKIGNLTTSRDESKTKFESLKDKLIKNKLSLDGLNIEFYEEKVSKAKEGNEKLKQDIEQDKEEFAKLGFDITEKDIIDSSPKMQQATTQEATKTADEKAKDGSKQPEAKATAKPDQASQQQQSVTPNTQPTQNSNLPVNLTPAQRAKVLKDKILGGSDAEAKALLDTDAYSDILSLSNNYNKKDKKALLDKLGTLNSKVDVAKLGNIISAISKSGLCSGLNVDNMFADGKLKDFSKLSSKDIDDLNTFVSEVDKNKSLIDDEQLSFLQNGFINNVKYSSLAASLKPKGFKDFFKSKHARINAEQKSTKINNLCASLPNISAPKAEEASKFSSFFNTLTASTRDGIYPPPPRTKEDLSKQKNAR